jgi:hypothetical protein
MKKARADVDGHKLTGLFVHSMEFWVTQEAVMTSLHLEEDR